MAQMAQMSASMLQRRGSMVLGADGTWQFKLSTKYNWDSPKLKRMMGDARRKSLIRCGLILKQTVKKGMSGSRGPRSPLTRPKHWTIGSRHGFELVALVDRVPKSDRVTSWRTQRYPGGMLRSDIEDDYDTARKTVVVGPSKFPKINQLHEFGGRTTRHFVPIPKRARGNRVYGVLTNVKPTVWTGKRGGRARSAPEQAGIYTFSTRVKARPYMGSAIKKARSKIPQQFRNQLRGP